MRKRRLFCLSFLVTLLVGACSNSEYEPKLLKKEGIAPYELSQRDEYLLQSFGLANLSELLLYNAPKEAITLKVNFAILDEEGEWELIDDDWGISIGTEREPEPTLKGTLALIFNDDHRIDVNINSCYSFSITPPEFSIELMGWSRAELMEFQTIELNQPIPIALMAYTSGSSMRSYAIEHYFDTSVFEGVDVVHAITLTFTEQEL